jgi:hypothetical protein
VYLKKEITYNDIINPGSSFEKTVSTNLDRFCKEIEILTNHDKPKVDLKEALSIMKFIYSNGFKLHYTPILCSLNPTHRIDNLAPHVYFMNKAEIMSFLTIEHLVIPEDNSSSDESKVELFFDKISQVGHVLYIVKNGMCTVILYNDTL